MQTIVIGLIGVMLTASTVFLAALAGAAFGALGGWIVGWTTFGDWILHVLASVGAKGFTMAQLGSLLGFLGGFLRASSGKSS